MRSREAHGMLTLHCEPGKSPQPTVICRWAARDALFGLTFSFKGHGGVSGIASKQGTGNRK
jgi:hypothetical protein